MLACEGLKNNTNLIKPSPLRLHVTFLLRESKCTYFPGLRGSWIAMAAMSVYMAALVTDVISVPTPYVSSPLSITSGSDTFGLNMTEWGVMRRTPFAIPYREVLIELRLHSTMNNFVHCIYGVIILFLQLNWQMPSSSGYSMEHSEPFNSQKWFPLNFSL